MKFTIFILQFLLFTSLGAYAKKTIKEKQTDMDKAQRIENLEEEVKKLSNELRELRKEDQKIETLYKFSTPDGDRTLEELFQDKKDLIVIHNMGKNCPYCTSYADGINGVLKHLEDRTSVVLLSPDRVNTQTKFAKSRGWKFRMISSQKYGEKFNSEMGFYKTKDGIYPGFSVFHKEENTITKVTSSFFDPGDEYCVLFPFISMLKDGAKDWHPMLDYKATEQN